VLLLLLRRPDTPGCTKESCGSATTPRRLGSEAPSSSAFHPMRPTLRRSSQSEYELTFSAARRRRPQSCGAFDVWKEKSMYGKTYMGVERTTFSHRTGWNDREDLSQGEAGGPRRRGRRRPLIAPWGRAPLETGIVCPTRDDSRGCDGHVAAVTFGTNSRLP